MSRIVIEVCVDSIESATAAVAGGADRLEVCANLGAGGGATPSIGLIRALRRRFPDTPLMVCPRVDAYVTGSLLEQCTQAMVRPRIGDFVYTDDELEIMLEDIAAFREAGVAGVVLGVLTADGHVDVERSGRLVSAARGLEVTFHRALDMALDVEKAFDAIKNMDGVTRVLTSGGQVKALDGLRTLEALARGSTPGVTILPGSGVNSSTVGDILRPLLPLGVREVHMSGGVWLESVAHEEARREGMDMGGWKVWRTVTSNVKAVRDIADALG